MLSWSKLVQKLYPTVANSATAAANRASPQILPAADTNMRARLSTGANPVCPRFQRNAYAEICRPDQRPRGVDRLTNDNARYTFTSRGGG